MTKEEFESLYAAKNEKFRYDDNIASLHGGKFIIISEMPAIQPARPSLNQTSRSATGRGDYTGAGNPTKEKEEPAR